MKIKSAVWQGAHCTEEIMSACALCPRECLADRSAGKKGCCGMDERIYLARAALHMWRNSCISGTKGSGAVFFPGAGCAAVSARIMILPSGAGDGL